MFSRFYFLLLVLMTTSVDSVAQNNTVKVDIDSDKLKEFYNYIKWTYNYGTQKEFDSTARYSKRALILAEELNNKDLIAYAKFSAARVLYWQLNTEDARLFLNDNVSSTVLKDSLKSRNYLLLGEIDLFERKYKDAATHLIKANELIEEHGINSKKDSIVYTNVNLKLGELYKNLKEYSKAHSYYDIAYQFYTNKNESSYVLLYISELFQEEDKIEEAIASIKRALEIIGDNPDGKLFKATYYLELSELFLNLKKPDSAVFYGKSGIYNNLDCQVDLLNEAIGDGYAMYDNYNEASSYYNTALDVSGSKEFEMEIHEKLRDMYIELKDYKNALTHNGLFLKLKDSITELKVKQEVTEITEKYESNKKQLQIEKLKIDDLQNQTLINEQKASLKFISIGLLSSLIILGLIFYGYLQQKKQRHLLFVKNLQLAKDLKNKVSVKTQIKNKTIEITDYNRDKIQLSIEKLIDDDFYLDQDISLAKMAKLVETNTSYLSKIINENYDKTFSNFINDLRISYTLKSLELQPKIRNFTIEHIADKGGFSSSSTFYNAFKKYTGLTPSYYIKKRIAS